MIGIVETREVEAVEAPAAPRARRVRRFVLRVAMLFTAPLAAVIAWAGVSSAAPLPVPSDAPQAGTVSGEVASTVSNALVTNFLAVLPYIVAVLVIFTIVGLTFRWFKLRHR